MGAKEAVARLLARLDLNPIILHEQPNKGRTVIETFEAYSDVGFAVPLLTPDDIGATKTTPEKLLSRARQNVILELGYFIGRLSRTRVCALYVEGVELPSDIHGVLYVPLDAGGVWRWKLASIRTLCQRLIECNGNNEDFRAISAELQTALSKQIDQMRSQLKGTHQPD